MSTLYERYLAADRGVAEAAAACGRKREDILLLAVSKTVPAECKHALWSGLMTMAPLGAPEAELKSIFGRLAAERDRLARNFGRKLPLLSMGMSGDYREAIACWATVVRLGTCIFSDAGE